MVFSGAANRSHVCHTFLLMKKNNKSFTNEQTDLQSRRGTGVAADFTAQERFVDVANDGCRFWMNLATVWSDLKPHRWFCVYWNHEPERYFCCSAHLLAWFVSLKDIIRNCDSLKSPCWKSGVNQDTHCLQCVCVSAPVWVFSRVCVSG